MRDGAIHYKLYLLKLKMAIDNIVFRINKFKNVFVYEIGLIAIRKVSPPFDEEQPYGRPCSSLSTALVQHDRVQQQFSSCDKSF